MAKFAILRVHTLCKCIHDNVMSSIFRSLACSSAFRPSLLGGRGVRQRHHYRAPMLRPFQVKVGGSSCGSNDALHNKRSRIWLLGALLRCRFASACVPKSARSVTQRPRRDPAPPAAAALRPRPRHRRRRRSHRPSRGRATRRRPPSRPS